MRKAGFVQLDCGNGLCNWIYAIGLCEFQCIFYEIVVPDNIFLNSRFFERFQGALRIVPLGDNIKIPYTLYIILHIYECICIYDIYVCIYDINIFIYNINMYMQYGKGKK